MKTIWTIGAVVLMTASAGAGPLTPPAAPAPTMKPLDEVESRTPISSLPFTITESGSYYVTKNLTLDTPNGNGIIIQLDDDVLLKIDVTLDLNGFTLAGAGSTGVGILMSSNTGSVKIRNGVVRDWGTGIYVTGNTVQLETLAVVDCSAGGILAAGSHGGGHIKRCIVSGVGSSAYGIYAFLLLVTECSVQRLQSGAIGIKAWQSMVVNCNLQFSDGVAIEVESDSAIKDNFIYQDLNAQQGLTAIKFTGSGTATGNHILRCNTAFQNTGANKVYAASNVLMEVATVASGTITQGTGDNANVSLP